MKIVRITDTQITAMPVSFPDKVRILYHPLDEFGSPTGEALISNCDFTWEQVKWSYSIAPQRATEIEQLLRQGHNALLREVRGEEHFINVQDEDAPPPAGTTAGLAK